MNFRIILPIALLSASNLLAGGFGGPPPFTNGSPLPSGTDGKYQMVATANNVTGIISFAVQNGTQSSAQSDNKWVIFVDGQILSGATQANISNDKVVGILDSGTGSIPIDDDGTIDLPLTIVIPGNSGSGTFSGSIDLNSPIAAISGKGSLQGTPSRVDQILIITGDDATSFSGIIDGQFVNITGATYLPIVIPGSTLEEVNFKIRGSRLSTPTATTASN